MLQNSLLKMVTEIVNVFQVCPGGDVAVEELNNSRAEKVGQVSDGERTMLGERLSDTGPIGISVLTPRPRPSPRNMSVTVRSFRSCQLLFMLTLLQEMSSTKTE